MIQTIYELETNLTTKANRIAFAGHAEDCSTIRSTLDSLFDGGFNSRDTISDAAFFGHLADCNHCRNAFYARFQVQTFTRSRLF
jgi:hypothetical protein